MLRREVVEKDKAFCGRLAMACQVDISMKWLESRTLAQVKTTKCHNCGSPYLFLPPLFFFFQAEVWWDGPALWGKLGPMLKSTQCPVFLPEGMVSSLLCAQAVNTVIKMTEFKVKTLFIYYFLNVWIWNSFFEGCIYITPPFFISLHICSIFAMQYALWLVLLDSLLLKTDFCKASLGPLE